MGVAKTGANSIAIMKNLSVTEKSATVPIVIKYEAPIILAVIGVPVFCFRSTNFDANHVTRISTHAMIVPAKKATPVKPSVIHIMQAVMIGPISARGRYL